MSEADAPRAPCDVVGRESVEEEAGPAGAAAEAFRTIALRMRRPDRSGCPPPPPPPPAAAAPAGPRKSDDDIVPSGFPAVAARGVVFILMVTQDGRWKKVRGG